MTRDQLNASQSDLVTRAWLSGSPRHPIHSIHSIHSSLSHSLLILSLQLLHLVLVGHHSLSPCTPATLNTLFYTNLSPRSLNRLPLILRLRAAISLQMPFPLPGQPSPAAITAANTSASGFALHAVSFTGMTPVKPISPRS